MIKKLLQWLLSLFEDKLVYMPGVFSENEQFNKNAFEFYKKLKPLAEKWGISPAIGMAQWQLESYWGTRPSGRHNYFGIKAMGKINKWWKGEKSSVATHEYINGQKVKLKDGFRSYDTVDDGINDYLRLLDNRYKKGTDLTGYATAPKYIEKIYNTEAIMKKSIYKLENQI